MDFSKTHRPFKKKLNQHFDIYTINDIDLSCEQTNKKINRHTF